MIPATTEIYTLSQPGTMPLYRGGQQLPDDQTDRHGDGDPDHQHDGEVAAEDPGTERPGVGGADEGEPADRGDRKSTRLNSSHANISYAVFCLKKIHRMTSTA